MRVEKWHCDSCKAEVKDRDVLYDIGMSIYKKGEPYNPEGWQREVRKIFQIEVCEDCLINNGLKIYRDVVIKEFDITYNDTNNRSKGILQLIKGLFVR